MFLQCNLEGGFFYIILHELTQYDRCEKKVIDMNMRFCYPVAARHYTNGGIIMKRVTWEPLCFLFFSSELLREVRFRCCIPRMKTMPWSRQGAICFLTSHATPLGTLRQPA